MTDLIIQYKEFIIPIFTVLAMGVGYLIKELVQKNKNKKTALFLLLEIWHRQSVTLVPSFDDRLDLIINKCSKKYNFELPKEEREHIIRQMVEVSKNSLEISMNQDITDYEKKFNQSITLIASEDPIFAYKINNINSMNVETYMNSLDMVNDDSIKNDIIFDNTKNILKDKEKKDLLIYLEQSIKSLAFKINILTYLKTSFVIKNRKRIIQRISEDEMLELEDIFDSIMISYLNILKNSLDSLNEKS